MHAVMKDIDYVQKEDKKVNNQYKFVSHDAVTATCRKAFVEHGVLSVPTVVEHTVNGNRTVMAVKVEFINIDTPDDRLETISYGYGIDGQDKGVGKAYSYAIKYAYLKVLGLETGDDPERDNIDYKPEPKGVEAIGGSMAKEAMQDDEAIKNGFDTAMNMLRKCNNLEELTKLWKAKGKVWQKLGDEPFKLITELKDELKAELD